MNCRIFSAVTILIIALVCWFVPINAWGFYQVNGIYYELKDDNTAEVCSNPNYYSGEITIPASITLNFGNARTFIVTSIGYNAFNNCTGLTEVHLPNSLRTIGSGAFERCTGLTYMYFNEGLTDIEWNAFRNCSNLATLYIPSSVNRIGDSAFLGTSWYNNQPDGIVYAGNVAYSYKGNMPQGTIVRIKEGTVGIGSYAFWNCSGMTSLTIPNSLITIGFSAFSGCSGLTSVTLPNSIVSIEGLAFYECTSLSSITIPSSVTYIGENAFSKCWNLASISVENNNPCFDSRDNCNAIIQTENNILISGCKNTVIPSSVTSIGNCAFQQCNGLSSITIPNGVEVIGSKAFMGCEDLTSVEISNSVSEIGPDAFQWCTGLTSFKTKSKTPALISDSFDEEVMSSCTLYVPANSKTLYQSADIWSEFKNIEEYYDTDDLEVISFGYCGNSITYTIYNDWSMVISGTGEMDNFVFNYEEVHPVNRDLNWVRVNNLTIEEGVSSIGDYAFYGCHNLTSVTIPGSVSSIGFRAFADCPILTYLNINDLPAWCQLNFYFGSPIECEHSLYLNWEIINDLVIPNEVTAIGNYTFYRCANLTSVTIPNSVTSIGEFAFEYCGNLASVSIESCETEIGWGAFDNTAWWDNQQDGLVYVGYIVFKYKGTMPEGTVIIIEEGTIGILRDAFFDCSGLTSVTIPGSVANIGTRAFSDCSSLTSITMESETPAPIDYETFYNVDKEACTLYVPMGFKSAYESAAGWNEFENIVEYTPAPEVIATGSCGDNVIYTIYSDMSMVISGTGEMWDEGFFISDDYRQSLKTVVIEEGVTSIGHGAFDGCSSLTSVTIPNSVTRIGQASFYGCTSLTSVTIPDGVRVLSMAAFEGCKNLTAVTIPDGITSIESQAFFDCTSLLSVTIPNSVTFIGPYAFDNTAWFNYQADGMIFINDVAYKYKGEMPEGTSFVIRDGTVCISDLAFSDCIGLSSVKIPISVTSIGDGAFRGCSSLSSVIIPNGVSMINEGVFAGCSNLCSVLIPSSVTTIGNGAFLGCIGLTSMTIPINVNRIRMGAFAGCSNLTSIYTQSTTPAYLGDYEDNHYVGIFTVFDGIDKNMCKLYVPIGSKSLYENADGWSDFVNIVEYEPNTDISALDNAIYVEQTEGRIGGTTDIPVKLKNSLSVRGFQFAMELPKGAIINSWALSTNRLPSGATLNDKIATQKIEGNKITVACSLNYGDATFTGNDGEIATVNVTFGDDMEVGTYPIYLTACDVTTSSGVDEDLSDVTATLVLEDYVVGDANGDGKIRIGDATTILNYIVGTTSDNFKEKAADANGDGKIRIGDATTILNIIVNQ